MPESAPLDAPHVTPSRGHAASRGAGAGRARERIYTQLRDDIISGKYPGGTFLVEGDLSAEFGVSRTPVREALIRLSQDRFIELIPNRGAFVPPLTMKDIHELYELRIANDGYAAYLCAGMRSPDVVRELKESTEREEVLLEAEDYRAASIEDLHFHSVYIAGSGSRRLIEMIDLIEHQMLRVMRLASDRHANLRNSLGFHKQLVDAVEAGDQRTAREIVEAHWESNRLNFMQRYIEGTVPEGL